jgi:predicted SAM-dependent methyltransferase
MIKKAYANIKSNGVSGLLKAMYSRPLPQRLEYYPYRKSFFESGVGLEIGGPSGIFRQQGCIPVYSVATRIDNCNFGSQTLWEGVISEGDTFIFDNKKAPGTQYIAEASNLRCIEDSTYEFVLSSHCIEHLANPLKGFAEWIRVLKQDGVIALIVPHKDGTFDHRRPVTSLQHLVQDFESQTDESDMTHLEEILRLHDLSKDSGAGDFASFQQRSKRNVDNRCLHQHVFDTRLAVEVVNYMKLQILAVELFHPYHIIIMAQKVGQNQPINNEIFRGIDEAPCWSSPFPSDRLSHHEMA